MAGGFGAASLPLISAIALLAGAVLLILGFATPNWANDGVHYVGLWRYGRCVNEDSRDCYHYDQPSLIHIPGMCCYLIIFYTNMHILMKIFIPVSNQRCSLQKCDSPNTN